MIILNMAAFWPDEESRAPDVACSNLPPSQIAKTLRAENIAAEGI
jgi:hypothetical protein